MNTKLIENKNLYKIFLSTVKYIPMLITILHLITLICNYYGLSIPLLAWFGGISVMFVILLYIMSYIFRFCYLYRIPLKYITSILILNMLRSIGLLPLDIINLYRLYVFIFGIFLVVFIIYMYKNRNNPKVDYIKQLCDTYCGC
jgi:hypothetical protein